MSTLSFGEKRGVDWNWIGWEELNGVLFGCFFFYLIILFRRTAATVKAFLTMGTFFEMLEKKIGRVKITGPKVCNLFGSFLIFTAFIS